ncbi:YopX family protein [Candidatus Dojkabacteria bacterium]|jgi:uncharacterized phage protein (TIGR01671 family)|nr:YopX family protein [Candidatus Dojkabacteria bacterium]
MNREIKFRAWDKVSSKMYFVYQMSFFWDGDRGADWNRGAIKLCEDTEDFSKNNWKAPGDIEIMQYTGLKDKNGKEIYEGDILKCGNVEKFEVKWIVTEHKCFVQYGYPDTHNFHCSHWCEVIGNIYENPELINP